MNTIKGYKIMKIRYLNNSIKLIKYNTIRFFITTKHNL